MIRTRQHIKRVRPCRSIAHLAPLHDQTLGHDCGSHRDRIPNHTPKHIVGSRELGSFLPDRVLKYALYIWCTRLGRTRQLLEGLHDAHITDPQRIERDAHRLGHLVNARGPGDGEHERGARGGGCGARKDPGGVSAAPDEGPKERLAGEGRRCTGVGFVSLYVNNNKNIRCGSALTPLVSREVTEYVSVRRLVSVP